jgi:hypothetical protein
MLKGVLLITLKDNVYIKVKAISSVYANNSHILKIKSDYKFVFIT